MGINTGDNGFSIDGKTYTYDVGDPSAPGLEPQPTNHGDIHIDDSKKDISKRTKETLSKYLSDLTNTNAYGIDAQTVEKSTTSPEGTPPPLADTDNTEQFIDRSEIKLPFDLPQQLRSGNRNFDHVTDPNTKLNISKGKATPQNEDGNAILQGVKGGIPGKFPAGIAPYVSTVLSNNRFTDASRAAAVSDITNPGKTYDPTLKHPKYGDVSMNRLAQVGVALSIRSSQELGAREGNPSSGAQEARSLLPGFNQLGAARINSTVLEAKDVLDDLTKSEIPDEALISIAPGGSWGSMNNVQDPYSGITAIGMIAMSAALTAAIVILFEGLGFIMSLVKEETTGTHHEDGSYILGRYTLTPAPDPNAFPPSIPPNVGALLGIRGTRFPFSKALQTGVAAFFGINTSGGILGQLTSGLTSVTENPGFNSVVARSIIRSSLTIIDAFKGVGKSSNLISGVKNVLSVIEVIRSSKLISAMNVFANLGDQILIEESINDEVKTARGEPKKVSRIDNLSDSSPAVQKNRLNGSLKLAWSSNRSPTSYLIPDTTLTLAIASGGKLGSFNLLPFQSDKAKNYFKIIGLTEQVTPALLLPYDSSDATTPSVKSIEDALDAEYMPFYFHDLRTNEIISFHAFITQLGDDFTANWEQSDGVGRVDPVRIYKNTQRKINVGFFIAATSDEDFDDMWMKINKLITLVYPQYTQGRVLTTPDDANKFVQPFSQLIGASPLVRLRLGDVFRSNYSRFALARLFGADSNSMKLNGTDLKFSGAVQSLKSTIDTLRDSPASGDKFMILHNDARKPSDGTTITVPLPPIPGISSGNGGSVSPTLTVVEPTDLPYFIFTVKNDKGDSVIVTPSILQAGQLYDFYGISASSAGKIIDRLKNKYDGDNVGKNVVGGQYQVPKSSLRLPPDRLRTVMQTNMTTAIDGVDALSTFLDPQNNAVAKSFRDVQGKGLAGTIDSIGFDFNNVTWETLPNKRAPQFCRVTISFSPIHDISPGLDHLGYNRAPLYPVGHQTPTNDITKEGQSTGG